MDEVTVDTYDDYTLSMSDLVFAWEIGDFQDDRELRRGGLRIVPNTLENYTVHSNIPIYFEIYNLTYSPEENTHYRLTYTVQSEERKGGVGEFFSRLLGRGKKLGKVITSYEYQGERRSEKFYQDLKIEGGLPGEYTIGVEVIDLISGEKVFKKKLIGLSDNS